MLRVNDFNFYRNAERLLLTPSQKAELEYPPHNQTEANFVLQVENIRTCARCTKQYTVDPNGYATSPLDVCFYHPLRKCVVFGRRIFPCCNRILASDGCLAGITHVSDRPYPLNIKEYEVIPPSTVGDSRSPQVYAVNCEMCFTTHGLELCKVSVVDKDLELVFESIVVPEHPVIDYNERFTGVTKGMIESKGISFGEVRARLLQMWNAETILVGHALNFDLHALKLIHDKVIDTIVTFLQPSDLGQRSLRDLAKERLGKDVQKEGSVHNSVEDAQTAMELIRLKMEYF